MAANMLNLDTESESEITITEVWPDQFEVTFNVSSGEMPVATTHTLDREQLQSLQEQINAAMD